MEGDASRKSPFWKRRPTAPKQTVLPQTVPTLSKQNPQPIQARLGWDDTDKSVQRKAPESTSSPRRTSSSLISSSRTPKVPSIVQMPSYDWTTGGDTNLSHERVISYGATSGVHEMVEISTKKHFAQKIIHQLTTIASIEGEFQAIKSLCNNETRGSLVEVLECGQLQNSHLCFIDMELCSLSLRNFLNQQLTAELRKATSESAPMNAWKIMENVTRGLSFIHKFDFVHRDIKPENVLFSRDGCWKLADFGLAMEGFTRLAKTTHYARGTDGYRAPELLLIEDEGGKRPHYTKKSDIWSLGCIFYELLVSKRAFTTDIAARDYSLSNTPLEIPYPSDFIHADTATPLIRAMLALDPQKRPSAKTTCSTVGGYLAKMTLPYPWTNTERTLPEFQLVVDDSLDSFGVKEFNRLFPHPLWELEQASLHVLRTLYPQVQTHEFKPFKLAEPVPLVLRNETRKFHASHQRTTRTDATGQIQLGSELVLCTQNLSILANCGRGDDWFIEEVRGLMIFCLGHAWQWGQASRGVPNGLTQDFVRLRSGTTLPYYWDRAPNVPGKSWDDGLDTTAYFLDYVDEVLHPGFVGYVNEWLGKCVVNNVAYDEKKMFAEIMPGWGWEKLWEEHCRYYA